MQGSFDRESSGGAGRRSRPSFVSGAAILLLFFSGIGGCAARARTNEISRERAIEIAKPHASFPIGRVEAEKAISDGRPVWRVRLQSEPEKSQPLLKETVVVEVDRATGSVVSVGKS